MTLGCTASVARACQRLRCTRTRTRSSRICRQLEVGVCNSTLRRARPRAARCRRGILNSRVTHHKGSSIARHRSVGMCSRPQARLAPTLVLARTHDESQKNSICSLSLVIVVVVVIILFSLKLGQMLLFSCHSPRIICISWISTFPFAFAVSELNYLQPYIHIHTSLYNQTNFPSLSFLPTEYCTLYLSIQYRLCLVYIRSHSFPTSLVLVLSSAFCSFNLNLIYPFSVSHRHSSRVLVPK